MKIKDILDKVDLLQKTIDLKEERIKLLEDSFKSIIEALKKREEFEEGQDWETRYYAADELNKDLKKRLEALEEAHPTVLKGPSDYENWPPKPGIPHEHKEEKK